MYKIFEIDKNIFEFFNITMASRALDYLMISLSSHFGWIIVLLTVIIFAILKHNKKLLKLLGLMTVTVIMADALSYHALKPFFARIRPCKLLLDVRIVDGCAGWQSFPSNHATNVMVVATMVWLYSGRRYGLPAVMIALAIGISRIYLGAHYPLDILGGFLFGSICGMTAYLLQQKIAALLAAQRRGSLC